MGSIFPFYSRYIIRYLIFRFNIAFENGFNISILFKIHFYRLIWECEEGSLSSHSFYMFSIFFPFLVSPYHPFIQPFSSLFLKYIIQLFYFLHVIIQLFYFSRIFFKLFFFFTFLIL
uniref:Uncharacterized protein n=1 Tax=Cacopsylla melanoneura TaxID=428564 RepID=A0A8D8Q9A9_9HEMI